MNLEEEDHRSKVSFSLYEEYVLPLWLITADVNAYYWCMLFKFSIVKLWFFSPFIHNPLWKEVVMCNHTNDMGNYEPPLWGYNIFLNNLGFFCMRNLSISTIDLFIQSFNYIVTNSYMFILYFYFFSQIVPALVFGSFLFGIYVFFTWTHHCIFLFVCLSATIYFRLILCMSCPSQTINYFSKDFWPLIIDH